MGKPFISHQIEVLSQITKEIFIVANSKDQVKNYLDNIDIKNILAFILDDDKIMHESNFRNPMLGLYSTFKELKNLNYEKVFVFSCDNPLIEARVIQFMLEDCRNYDCCIPRWNNGFLEPLFAIYPISMALKTTEKNLMENMFKLTNIINKNWNIHYISIEDSIKRFDPNLLSFQNLNEISQIKDMERFLNQDNNKKKEK